MSDDLPKFPGPILLLAGPGTGKTYHLGKRIKFLVEDQEVPPENITVITFTAAAAKNMRNRISDMTKPEIFLPYIKQPTSIRTMHSLGYKLLKENQPAINPPDQGGGLVWTGRSPSSFPNPLRKLAKSH